MFACPRVAARMNLAAACKRGKCGVYCDVILVSIKSLLLLCTEKHDNTKLIH
jgi:hypothetical protein